MFAIIFSVLKHSQVRQCLASLSDKAEVTKLEPHDIVGGALSQIDVLVCPGQFPFISERSEGQKGCMV